VRPLNFASQPFRNERLPALLFGVAAVVLVAVTVRHALVLRALLPARTSKLHREVAALETELDRLRAEGRSLAAPQPDKQALAEWSVLKDLVDRRTFSWTGLFARLEQVLPREVRLVSIAPDVKNGQVVLDIVAVARPSQVGLSLVGLLEQRAEFEDVYPVRVSERDGGEAEFNYTMRYLPGAVGDEPVAAAVQADHEAMPAVPQPTTAAAPAPSPLPAAAAPPLRQGPPAAPLRKDRRSVPPPDETPSEKNPTPPPAKPAGDAGDVRTLSRKPPEREH
jgi:Tfp pilus assembly protein PilN